MWLACASPNRLRHGVNRSNAWVVLHCYNVLLMNISASRRMIMCACARGQKVRRKNNLAPRAPLPFLTSLSMFTFFLLLHNRTGPFRSGGGGWCWGLLLEYFLRCLPENQVLYPNITYQLFVLPENGHLTNSRGIDGAPPPPPPPFASYGYVLLNMIHCHSLDVILTRRFLGFGESISTLTCVWKSDACLFDMSPHLF